MDIRINQAVWDAVSSAEQQQIITHLQQHEVLKPGQGVIGDANVKAPAHDTPLYGATIGEAFTHSAMAAFGLPVPPWLCRAACDAAAAAAAAACTATGPALAACLVAIAAANQACRDGC
ncbi:MAG: hypothetical protein FD176_837 [Rhodospirillaceae bacterium]|nr:MAG: hypothetical protein FD176_837 [Rhodospirillaceae bacterium]TNC97899.1 MAG: hypothetical protein FD119_887 [Stygiobacter sp.]